MDINDYRKFIFIREMKVNKDSKFKIGDEIMLYRGHVYINGCLTSRLWEERLIALMEKEIKDQYYLAERKIIKNKV